jgi:hypothetical protein
MAFDPNLPVKRPVKSPRNSVQVPTNPTRVDAGPAPNADELKRSFCDGLPADDSFREWASHTSDATFIRWAQMVFKQYAQESWDRATAVIASLRGGRKHFSERITMAELESSPAFQKLSDEDKRTAKWIITNQESLTLRARGAA